MDHGRDAMGLSDSGSYFIQGGSSGTGPPTINGSSQQQQGIRHLQEFGSGSTGFGSLSLHGDTSPATAGAGVVPHHNGVNMMAPPPPPSETPMKRKRGRPRRYRQDGSVSLALSSSSVSTVTPNNSNKRGRGRPPGSRNKQRLSSNGESMPSSSRMSFTPHVIGVSAGEDIASKVISFSRQGRRAICILSVIGQVSTATFLQPSASPRVITYEGGRFDILGLSTSYLVATDGSFRNETGNLSVLLASPDGSVIGGAIEGPLIAASPVQVIVGSFNWEAPNIENKKQEEAYEVVQDTGDHQVLNNDNNSISPVPQQPHQQASQNLIWSMRR